MELSLNDNLGGEVVDIKKFQNKAPKDAAKIAAWVAEQHKRAKNERTRLERQWYTNLAFYCGHQYIAVTSTANDNSTGRNFGLVVPKAPRWRVRLTTNKIRPIVRTELAKLTSQKPTAYVMPASSDDADLNAAKAGELIWESLYTRKRLPRVIRQALFWTSITGVGFTKTYWDNDVVDRSAPGDIHGDIVYEAENPFAIFVPDLVEEDIEGQSWVIHASAKSPDWVSLRYKEGLDGKELKPDISASNEVLDSGFLKLVGSNQNRKDSILCLEAWIKPGSIKMFPDGAVVTIVGGHVCQITEGLPYSHGEYPFAKIDHTPSGRFYADCAVTDLISLQKEYNRTRSQIIEAKNLMAKPQLMAPRGSIDPKKISSEPGQVILYTPGFQPPQPLPLQPLPSYVHQDLDRINADMEDISGQHEITKGQTPAGVTAATAISFLQEQDDSKLSHTIFSLESAIEKTARQTLSLVGDYWDDARTVQVVGQEHAFDAQVFTGANLNGNTDIRIEAGSALPQSKAAKQAFIMDLMKMGFIDPPSGLSVLDMSGIDKLYETYEMDQNQAKRENVKMQVGAPVMVNTWDNHQLHIMAHDNFRKSQAFENLDDARKALFEQHVQMHKLVLMGGMPPEMMPPNNQIANMNMDPAGGEVPPQGGQPEQNSGTQEQLPFEGQ